MVKESTWRALAFQQLPAGGSALVIAELFYNFHVFTLEAIAFVGTWFVLDAAIQTLNQLGQDALADRGRS